MRRAARLAAVLAAPLAVAAAPVPVAAQEAADRALAAELAREGEDIPPEEWLALVRGRTVWYRLGEDLWGRESWRGPPGRITFQFADGACLEARWTHAAPWYCFDFGAGLPGEPPHCFRHLRHDGALWALGDQGEPQAIDRIDRTPLACGEAPTS